MIDKKYWTGLLMIGIKRCLAMNQKFILAQVTVEETLFGNFKLKRRIKTVSIFFLSSLIQSWFWDVCLFKGLEDCVLFFSHSLPALWRLRVFKGHAVSFEDWTCLLLWRRDFRGDLREMCFNFRRFAGSLIYKINLKTDVTFMDDKVSCHRYQIVIF